MHRIGDPGEVAVPLSGLAHPTGDDQRRPGFIDQDRVDLIHDCVRVAALDHVLRLHGHVVAQVVEAELVVGSVGDVGRISRATLCRSHIGLDEPHLETEEAVDRAHPL